MVAFRTFVAALVTVLTLFGGAFRTQTALRAHLAIQGASQDAKQATLEVGRTVVQGRATKPSTPDPRDGVGPAFAPIAGLPGASVEERETIASPPGTEQAFPRVRPHALHMVFLI